MSVADHQLDVMLSKGVLTGSRKFNVSTANSDYDIIIKQSDVPTDLKETSWDYTVCFETDHSQEPSDADGIDSGNYDSWYEGSKVWGSTLDRIIKYYPEDPNDECECIEKCINLFIYDDSHTDILTKFQKLNGIMLFTMTTEQLAHRPTRVERFAELLIELEIAEGD
jgi:hypothetical protein